MQNRAEVIDQNFVKRVLENDLPDLSSYQDMNTSRLNKDLLIQLFESQLLSRHLDLCSRKLQARGESFYTIGSAGHEGNAAIAAAFRQDDMAFLHYRDAAFLIQRARQAGGEDPVWDMMLSFTTSSEDPISGGRHKVLGSKSLFVPPQTSTVASHLPKALGTAYSIPLAKRLDLASTLPYDSVVICSFGDASANHSTAQGAFNAACWAVFHKVPLPLVFICEDNGIGISTPTPSNWIEAAFSNRPGLHYLQCDGLNLLDTYQTACEAQRLARCHHQPVFLHVRCVRLLGHAGSDAEVAYRSPEQIEATEAQDPLLHSARLLIDNAVLSPVQVVSLYQAAATEVAENAKRAIVRPKLRAAEEVMRSLIPPHRSCSAPPQPSAQLREALFKREQKNMQEPQHMARLINWTLTDLMARHPEIIMMGEDIGPKGGVYNVTGQLSRKFGNHRVINTLLDEQSILGLAIGSAHNGFLPIPEIQFLAYIHNAEDQIRGEAATLSFFSNGQYTNPMVIRIAGLGYQKGFGGHFHNDNSVNIFRDIPGIIVACPSNGQDAVEMLRECVRLARDEQRVVVFIEPIALYMTRDLHKSDDGLWAFKYQSLEHSSPIPLGRLGYSGDGTELAILSYGNGYYLSRQAAHILEQQNGIQIRVIDLRWLSPLNASEIVTAIHGCDRVLIVDECRRTGSVSEQLVTLITEEVDTPPAIKRICAEDSFIALGNAATATLPSKEQIISTALDFIMADRLRG